LVANGSAVRAVGLSGSRRQRSWLALLVVVHKVVGVSALVACLSPHVVSSFSSCQVSTLLLGYGPATVRTPGWRGRREVSGKLRSDKPFFRLYPFIGLYPYRV